MLEQILLELFQRRQAFRYSYLTSKDPGYLRQRRSKSPPWDVDDPRDPRVLFDEFEQLLVHSPGL